MDARLRRVNKEIAGACTHPHLPTSRPAVWLKRGGRRADCKNDKSSRVTIDLVDDNPFHLIGAFDGPEDTPYQGGRFQVVRPATLPSAHSRTISHHPASSLASSPIFVPSVSSVNPPAVRCATLRTS